MKREAFPTVKQWPELFRWPVHRDFLCSSKPVRVFDTWGEASTFAMQHNLYMGDPKRRSTLSRRPHR